MGTRAAGGAGAQVTATIPVRAGQVYAINVGGQGISAGQGGLNPSAAGNGGSGSSAGAGGGGAASDVRIENGSAQQRLIVAAGGGGGGGDSTVSPTGAGGIGGAGAVNGVAGATVGAFTGGIGGLTLGGTLTDGTGGDGGTAQTGGGDGGGGGGGWTGGFGGGAGATDGTTGAGGGGGAGGQNFEAAGATGITEGVAPQPIGAVTVTYDPAEMPAVQTQPTLSGVVKVGGQLTCELGTWSGAPSFAIQWTRNGAAIVGATNAQYTLLDADAGQQISCQVTATNANGSAVARTPAVAVPIGGPSNSALPTVTGTAAIGSRVTCNNGTWSQAPTFAYQWLRNGAPIAGATAQTYTETKTDAGAALQCAVKATASGETVTAQTAAVGGPARLVIMVATALVSKTGAVTVPIACYGPTNCVVPAITATSGGQVIARGSARTVHSGASSKIAFRLGKRGLAHLGKAGSSIAVRFVSTPTGGYGGNRRITFVALHGAKL
ncbi:MAG TPA: hypothetical protein VGM91_05885 [Conexibacter sp.]